MLEGIFANLNKAFNARDLAGFRKSYLGLRTALGPIKEVWEQMRPLLLGYYKSMQRHVASVEAENQRVQRSLQLRERLNTQMLAQARMTRRAVTGQILGGLPGVGKFFGAFQQAQAQRAQLQQTFATLRQAGAPVNRLVQALGMMQAAAGPLTMVLGLVKDITFGVMNLIRSIMTLGIRLFKLPISVMWSIHRVIQSITFSFLMFVHLFRRFFREAHETIKNVQVATLLASGSLEQYSKNLNYVLSISLRYGLAVDSIAKGLVKVSKAGFDAADAQEILNAAVKYATVFQTDLESAIDQVIKVIRAYGFEAGESSNITRMLYNSVRSTNASLGDLNTSLGYAAAQAASMNMSLEDTLVVTTTFIDMGLRASRAGMAFRSGMSRLERAIGAASGVTMDLNKAIEVLNVDWEALAQNTGDYSVMFKEFNKVVSDGVDLQEKLAFRAIFGQRYFAQYIRLFQQSEESYSRRMAAITAMTNLEERAQEMSNSLIGVIQRLQNVWISFKIAFLEELRDPIETVGEGMERLANVAQSFGAALGSLTKMKVLEPIISFFEDITQEEGLKKFENTLASLADEVGMQFDIIREAAGDWAGELLESGTKSFLVDIIRLVGTLAAKSIEISKTMMAAFKEMDMSAITKLITYASHFIQTLMPVAVGIAEDLLRLISAILDKIAPSLNIGPETELMIDKMNNKMERFYLEQKVRSSELAEDVKEDYLQKIDRAFKMLSIRQWEYTRDVERRRGFMPAHSLPGTVLRSAVLEYSPIGWALDWLGIMPGAAEEAPVSAAKDEINKLTRSLRALNLTLEGEGEAAARAYAQASR
jgi:TP901 family phage tail tape measure protein